jgi:predicted DNA-binding mobile mystery protein A
MGRPPRGWIRAIREALGMTSAQLGKRLGVSQPTALAYEKGEMSKSITLDSLERAAHALDCRLVYALVSRKPLQVLAEERARALARKRLHAVAHRCTAMSGAGPASTERAARISVSMPTAYQRSCGSCSMIAGTGSSTGHTTPMKSQHAFITG